MQFAAALVLLSALLAGAQTLPQDTAAEKSKLIAFENAWNQALIHRDGGALTRLIADTFVYTDWDGSVMNKARFLASNKDPDLDTTLLANEGVEVYFYPGVAVVTGAYHFKGTNKGKPFEHHGRFTDTWISSRGQWVCVASQAGLIRKSAGE
jgi:hypothetical protein